MKGTKYLSDVLDVNAFQKGVLNIVETPCGSGKTTAAIERIAPLASTPKKALYLIDTKSGFEQLAREEKLTTPWLWYEDEIAGHLFSSEGTSDKVVLTTYAKFGCWLSEYPNMADNFEIIICDEAHNVVEFAKYSEQPNCHSRARDALCQAVRGSKTMVVAISATPEPLEKMNCPRLHIEIDTSDLYHYVNSEEVPYAEMHSVLRAIPDGWRGALYVGSITQMKKFEAFAREQSLNPISIWSPQNTAHQMTDEQYAARTHIIEQQAIPDQYDLLIINGSCETAINIRSHLDYFITHTTNSMHITQARGRYRGDLQRLYLLDKETAHIEVPEKYLGHKLYQKEKKEMREYLNIRNEHGNLLPYDHLITRLRTCGYKVAEKEPIRSKRIPGYVIIEK